MRRLLPLAILACVSGCLLGEDDDGPGYFYGLAAIDSVQVLSAEAPEVQLRVFAGFPTPCWSLVDVQVESPSAGVYTVALNGRIRRGAVCAEVWNAFTRDESIDVTAPGTYTFRFMRRSGEPLEVIVQVM